MSASVACIERYSGQEIVIGDEAVVIKVIKCGRGKAILKVFAPPGTPVARRELFDRAKSVEGCTDATETRTN